jgi:hypothetical protein
MSIKACGSFDCFCGFGCFCGCEASSMKNEEKKKKKGTRRQNLRKKELRVDDCCDLDLFRLYLDVADVAA